MTRPAPTLIGSEETFALMKIPFFCFSAAALILTSHPSFGQELPVVSPPDMPIVGAPARHIRMPIHRNLHPEVGQPVAPAQSIPIWSGSTNGFTYQMVGLSPYSASSNTTVSVTVPVIPLNFTFADGSIFNASAADSCSPTGSASTLTAASPIFQNFSYSPGGVNVGNTQYLDFFQRANFWQYTSPSGINPNYHILLTPASYAPVNINVPSGHGKVATGGFCGGKIGEVDINWFDSYLQTTVFPQLASSGMTPSNFPLFVMYNTVLYDTSCCILGYHFGFYSSQFGNALQTYAVAEFDSTGAFGTGTRDISAASHEVGEWLDDPLGNNPTPPWGHIGQETGCDNTLEVGDALSGTSVGVTLNGFTYHPQELAFLSWFFDQSPSIGVNGWYSSNGTFKTGAVACGANGSPKVTLNPGSLTFASQAVGTTSATQNITLSNSGSGTLTISALSITGANAGDFGGSTNCSSSLAAGSSCTISIFFKPAATGTRSATLTVTDNAAGSPQSVSLTGTGGNSGGGGGGGNGTPTAVLSTDALNFGSQPLRTLSQPQQFTLTNTGTGTLSSISISIVGANPGDFRGSTNCGTSLAANSSCIVQVSFAPTATGSRSAAISISDNAAGSPQKVSLSGTGTSLR